MQIKTTRNDLRSAEPIVLWAVYAKEKNPPPGAKAIEWLLLTTKQVQTSEDAVRIVQYYCLRWRIEEWHRVLKSGCKVQEHQHTTLERLQRAIAIDVVLAWRIQCDVWIQRLLIAKRDLKLEGLLKRLSRFDVLVIDEIGYVDQTREQMEVLFTLLAHRYERGSVLITSNLPFSKWDSIFKDPMTAAAAIDRLVHHSVILEMNLSSYRAEQAQKKKGGKTQE